MRSRRKPSARTGRRPPSTTREGLSAVGIELFRERGFDETSVDEIAEAAGIARRTFFRYFPSKNAVPWGRLRRAPRAHARAPGRISGRHSTTRGPDLGTAGLQHLPRVRGSAAPGPDGADPAQSDTPGVFVGDVPGWRQVIAEFVARRTDASSDDHFPRTVGYLVLAVAVSAYEQWLTDDSAELPDLLASGMRTLYSGLNPPPAVPPNEAAS